jgi:hypothetical protein
VTMTTTIMARSCHRCQGDMISRYDEEPACRTCGHRTYPATTNETLQERRRATRRGFHIGYTGDHRNLAHLKVFVEPDKNAQYYRIRCPYDGAVVGNAHGGGYVGRDGETRGGGYVCREQHLIYVLRDHTNAPISWS